MTIAATNDANVLREQVLLLPEPQRAEIVSALLDSLRPPTAHKSSAALAHDIAERADAYHQGRLAAVDLDESVKLVREMLQQGRPM